MAGKTSRLERFSQRALIGLGGLALLGGAELTWYFSWAGGPLGAARWATGAAALGGGLLLLPVVRRALGERFGARRVAGPLLAVALVVGLTEGVANLVNPGGYLYYAQTQRYFARQRYQGVPESHAHRPHDVQRFPWGTVRTNALGWRGPEAGPRDSERLRLLVLGDSVVFSWGVDEPASLPVRLGAELEERLGQPVEALNAGNGSFDSVDELVGFLDKGLALEPDAVCLLVITNDFTDRGPYRDQLELFRRQGVDEDLLALMEPEAEDRPPPLGPSSQPARWLFFTTSYLLNRSYLATSVIRLRELSRSGGAGGTPRPELEPEEVVLDEATRADLRARHVNLISQTAALRALRRVCSRREIPLELFVYARNPNDNRGVPRLVAYLRELVGEEGQPATITDLAFPGGPGADCRGYVNSPTDAHWNPAGVQHFAELMAERLAERLKAPRED